MVARGYVHGHPIEYDEVQQKWVYSDTREPITNNRPCKKCGRLPTPEGYDVCLGYLPGVKNACCGHGVDGEGYIQFENGKRISL